jgi:VIT1/CCC1 family predicted Fe2+/Mn2+ transporter|uniref:VIT family protein n=1 Tax=viral metagenome TaxID=1070528 RepID=A0A6C0IV80_9ZZZZ
MNIAENATLGFTDGVNTVISVAAGMVASGQFTSQQIVIVSIAEAVSGSISMGMSRYMSLDGSEHDESAVIESFMVSCGFVIATLATIIAFSTTEKPMVGFRRSILMTLIVLFIFGYYRSVLLDQNFLYSIGKLLVICIVATVSTYFIAKRFDKIS